MGAAASTGAALNMQTATAEELEGLFVELDVEQTGVLPVEMLVVECKAYFDQQPTSQPETWIRSMISKFDSDRDGYIDMPQFLQAIAALRKC